MGLLIRVGADELVVGRKVDFLYHDEDDQVAVLPLGEPMRALVEWATKPRSGARLLDSSLDGAVLAIGTKEFVLKPKREFQIGAEAGREQNDRTWEVVDVRSAS